MEISLPRGTPAERHSRPAERHFGPDRTPSQVLASSQGGICASFCLTGEPAKTEQSNGNCKQAYAKVRPGIPDRPLDSWCPSITPTKNKRKFRISQLLISSGGALGLDPASQLLERLISTDPAPESILYDVSNHYRAYLLLDARINLFIFRLGVS